MLLDRKHRRINILAIDVEQACLVSRCAMEGILCTAHVGVVVVYGSQ